MNVEDVVQELGGITAAAKQLGVTPQAVWNWVNHHKSIPARRAIQIEELTNGKYKARDLINASNARSESESESGSDSEGA